MKETDQFQTGSTPDETAELNADALDTGPSFSLAENALRGAGLHEDDAEEAAVGSTVEAVVVTGEQPAVPAAPKAEEADKEEAERLARRAPALVERKQEQTVIDFMRGRGSRRPLARTRSR